MDGLTFALEQAGVYIEETQCSLSRYLELYRQHRVAQLKRRGRLTSDHPMPLAATWSLSFQKVISANSGAADLLRLCALLSPDAIPEEIITEGAPDLGRSLQSLAIEPFELDAAVEELRKYSLL